MKGLFALRLLLLSALFAGACSASTPAGSDRPTASAGGSAGGTTQTSEGGGVTVIATWGGSSAGAVFDVKLDTHSVNLDDLDLADAVLRNDRGEVLTATPWAAPKGGHHREGALAFGGDAKAFLAGTKWVELVLTGIGELPTRTLHWDVTS